jgi:hypothetical protein
MVIRSKPRETFDHDRGMRAAEPGGMTTCLTPNASPPSSPPSSPSIPFSSSLASRLTVLRFAASFLWADLVLLESERVFLARLATELGIVPHARREIDDLLARPPPPEDVDPNCVSPALAAEVRRAALRAIAADGKVARAEMRLFYLLDELLPGRSGVELSNP